MPFVYDREIIEAFCDVCGLELARVHWRATANDLSQSPVIVPGLSRMTSTIGADDPARVFRIFPKTWTLAYRGFGEPEVTASRPGALELLLKNVHPVTWQVPAYFYSLSAGLAGTLDVVAPSSGHEVSLTTEEAASQVRFNVKWQRMSMRPPK